MAKLCINCGRKFSFYESSLELVYSKVRFCENCKAEAGELLRDIKVAEDVNKFPQIREKFERELAESSYEEEVKGYIRNEFNSIADNHSNTKHGDVKYFVGSFEESYDIISEVGKRLADVTYTPKIVNFGNAKTTTFVFDKYFVRNGAFVSLTVNLTSCRETSAITVISSGGGDDALQMNWGTEKALVKEFWDGIFGSHAEYMNGEISEEDFNRRMNNLNQQRIGILGGTFDPVHMGHKVLGEAAIKEANLRMLIVMPARIQPFKQGKRVTEDYHRKVMAELTFEDMKDVIVSDYELNNTVISYTYDTLAYLKKIYPDDTLYFIMGTDSFLDVEDWYKGVDLLKNFSFAVSVRPGYREAELHDKIEEFRLKYNTEVIKIHTQMPDVSSTEIRRKIAMGDSVSHLLSEDVERYIKKHGLYK